MVDPHRLIFRLVNTDLQALGTYSSLHTETAVSTYVSMLITMLRHSLPLSQTFRIFVFWLFPSVPPFLSVFLSLFGLSVFAQASTIQGCMIALEGMWQWTRIWVWAQECRLFNRQGFVFYCFIFTLFRLLIIWVWHVLYVCAALHLLLGTPVRPCCCPHQLQSHPKGKAWCKGRKIWFSVCSLNKCWTFCEAYWAVIRWVLELFLIPT